MELEMAQLSVKEIAQRVRQGLDAPERAAQRALDQIRKHDGVLRAWAFVMDAGDVGSLVGPTTLNGPLAGIPVGVKDVIDVADMPTRSGSLACRDLSVQFDAASVGLLRAAGAIPIGKTVTAEFAFKSPGATRNPVNIDHTPGGSSSGSAAAVAAGMVPVALGTQTGGSMIRPAAFCGVIGFKPTFGSLHRDGLKLTCDSLDTIGWYGRTVSDVATVGQVLLPQYWAGGAQAAKAAVPAQNNKDLTLVRDLKITHLSASWSGTLLETEAENSLDVAAMDLRKAGAQVAASGGPVAALHQMIEAHSVIMHYEFAQSLAPVLRVQRDQLSTVLVNAVIQGGRICPRQYLDMKSIQADFRDKWTELFHDADLILTPSAPGPAPTGIEGTGSSIFNVVWSLLGWPCIHLPTSFAKNGLPLGVQLVARPGADASLLSWAESIHRVIDRRA
ncbi:amidase [Candidimonas sp. SYP-B2681]|uniref:amidase n=1 Tax=Candidimonas sp. SYP-B2681 TaxID=2497686 RepID=UPI000F8796D5|nr:amidase [Candidimonas sp. SYP-B2681]RTZ43142.1 amidase [Candidimonas sp. SYP-B2681]